MLENTSTPQVVIGDYGSDLYIGSYGGDISRYAINAIIDDIKIYNRALSNDEVYQLYTGSITANFSADTTNGIAPFTVQFSDQSTTPDSLIEINSWQWDFENDGFIDSEEQNPEWTYLEHGLYTVKLTVSDSINQAIEIKENYIAVLSESPLISSVDDTPNDQGGWVEVNFWRSIYDTDSLQGKVNSAELYTIEFDDSSGWKSVTSLVAYGKSQYSALVHTTRDSTAVDDGLINFRVIAGMEGGNFASQVVSGYSVDNLVPSVPEGLMATLGDSNCIKLNWELSTDEDFHYFDVYRNIENYFDNHSEPIFQTTDNSFTDNLVEFGNTYYYALKTVDSSGNMSDYSEVVSIQITSIKEYEIRLPSTYYLKQNYPNPFNPVTTISYGLPRSSNVKISIFDVTGKEIRTLVNEKQSAGAYNIEWNALNNSGKQVSSGMYIYKMESEGFQRINKMVLIR